MGRYYSIMPGNYGLLDGSIAGVYGERGGIMKKLLLTLILIGLMVSGLQGMCHASTAVEWYNKGNDWLNKGMWKEAIECYNRALELDPDLSIAYNNRGKAYGDLGQYDKALADCTRALELNPNLDVAYNNRGALYGKLEQYKKALVDFEKALSLNPDSALFYNNRGFAYYRLGRRDEALSDYNKAIDLDPDNKKTYMSRATIYWMNQDFEKAARDYGEAAELDPADTYAHILLFISRAKMGEDGKADLESFQAHKGDAKWPEPVISLFLGKMTADECIAASIHKSQQCEAYFYAGEYYLMKKDIPRAGDHFQKCIATDMKEYIEYRIAVYEMKKLGK